MFPIHADARQLPFAGDFFDAILCIDAFNYFGTDDLTLNYLVQFVKVGGVFAFASAGLMQDFGAEVPAHLERFWGSDSWTIHTAAWWRTHLAKTKLVDIVDATAIEDGFTLWEKWAAATDASAWYRETLREDAGRYLGYVGVIARRAPGRKLASYAWPSTLRHVDEDYTPHPILRES